MLKLRQHWKVTMTLLYKNYKDLFCREFRKACAQIKTQWPGPLRSIFCLLSQLPAKYQAPILRIRVLRRLLVRAALFLWIRPLLTIVSIFGTVSL